jgi:hypothetical protein
MAGSVQTLKKIWFAATGRQETAAPEVVIHDPSARKAHDLDDPFFDDNVQSRMAEFIAATGNRKTKNSY